MGWFVFGGLVTGLLTGAAFVMVLRRAAKTVALGAPTPEEQQIKTDIDQRIEFVREQDDTETREVMRADRDGLLARLRGLVRGQK